MGKTILYRIFGAGKIPKDALPQILREGIVLRDEGIRGSVTFRNYRAPGRYHGWRRTWFSGSLVITRKHFLAFSYAKPVIGLAWDDHRIAQLRCDLVSDEVLRVRFDAALFEERRSGRVEVRFSTPKSRAFLTQITRRTPDQSGTAG